ncbi:MAG: aspartate aminotransferase family protein [Myxococcota bacterium]
MIGQLNPNQQGYVANMVSRRFTRYSKGAPRRRKEARLMVGSKTKDLIERRRAAVARGVGMFTGDVAITSAAGAKLWDPDGSTMIDFASGLGVMNAGHSNPEVVRAMTEQAQKLIHSCIHIATYEPYVALCEKLTTLLPHGKNTKAMLVNSGAEAVENAVKIARQATGRPAILCYEGAFHGRTLLGMTLTAKSAYKKNCGPFAPEIYRLPFPNYYHQGNGLPIDDFAARELMRLRNSFVTGPVPAEHIAAIIIEVVQGEGGFVPAPPAYLRGLRQICDEHGILLICDEVQSGFGRTGTWAAYEHSGITPDLSTWAKAMGGGLPIGAVLGRADIMDAAEPGTLGGTYGGNPVACAGALATIRLMEDNNLNAKAQSLGQQIRQRLQKIYESCENIGDVRGLGAMMALEFSYHRDPLRPAQESVAKIVARCREQGLLVLTAGPYGNVIRILTPLVIEATDLQRGLDILEESILSITHEEEPA